MQICLQVQKLLINQSVYRSVPFWEIGLRKFVSYTTVLQQLQFKMPETVIRHHIWPLKVMFLNRIMPEAPNFDENRKSIFLTCRSKIVAFCIVTKYQCNWFRAVGSHMVYSRAQHWTQGSSQYQRQAQEQQVMNKINGCPHSVSSVVKTTFKPSRKMLAASFLRYWEKNQCEFKVKAMKPLNWCQSSTKQLILQTVVAIIVTF